MRTFFTRFSGLMLVSLSLALVLMTFGVAQAKESATTKTYVVVGTAALHGDNVTAAREKAISDGLVTAVALMTKELLEVGYYFSSPSKIWNRKRPFIGGVPWEQALFLFPKPQWLRVCRRRVSRL